MKWKYIFLLDESFDYIQLFVYTKNKLYFSKRGKIYIVWAQMKQRANLAKPEITRVVKGAP